MPNSGLMRSLNASKKRQLTRGERRNGKALARQEGDEFDDELQHSGGDRGRGIRPTAREMKLAALAHTAAGGD